MRRRPPRSTRTAILFPYTTRFRTPEAPRRFQHTGEQGARAGDHLVVIGLAKVEQMLAQFLVRAAHPAREDAVQPLGHFGRPRLGRSEARRVGKECVSTCRSRWSP